MRDKSTEHDEAAPKLIPVYDSLHTKMKSAAEGQGIPVYEAYAQASRLYLQNAGFSVPGIGSITPDEKTLIEEMLQIYRNRNETKILDEAITLVKSLIRFVSKTKA